MPSAVLVGCGAMSKTWLDAMAQVANLNTIGLVDIEPDRARARQAEFNLQDAIVGSDLSEVLRRAKPDMVFDVALPTTRLDVVRTAFEHGCHVLTEKPMASSLDEAREILALTMQAKRKHAVVQNRRYHGSVRRIRQFLESGALGKPTSVHADFFIAPHFGGFREEMHHVLLVDMAIHTFDACRLMIGADATSVYCKEWEPPESWFRHGSSALAVFTMADNVVFTYRGSWSARGFKTSWESAWRFVCEKGTLVWDGLDDLRAEVMTDLRDGIFEVMQPVEIPPLSDGAKVGGHVGVIKDFLHAIAVDGDPETSGRDNIKSLSMVFGSVRSSETRSVVEIEC